ncbi:MAG: riboflavin synthase [Planctomycetes bacterium]|nr:riboflavin synthase [Planctomycetota bacterium]
MFTGLIEALGKVEGVKPQGGGVELVIDLSGLKEEPLPGASIAVDGACLTITKIDGHSAHFDAVSETASRTTLGKLRPESLVNLESALRAGKPLDGHLVQGHVDAVGTLAEIRRRPESSLYRFTLPEVIAPLVAAKGSIAVSGVSLTVVEAMRDSFTVSLIPETLQRTTLGKMQQGSQVNLEADVIARYLARQRQFPSPGGLTEEMLRGF